MASLTHHNIEYLKTVAVESQIPTKNRTPMTCPFLDTNAQLIRDKFSSVMGDGFHHID